LAEECAEVAQASSKALRFGLDDKLTLDPAGPRGTEGPTNQEKIVSELNDLLGIVEMLVQRDILPVDWQDAAKQRAKADKVARYMEYATRVGALKRGEPDGQ
jgi:NTP pyrophosphatase (non-canonical NTP hydrolase)